MAAAADQPNTSHRRSRSPLEDRNGRNYSRYTHRHYNTRNEGPIPAEEGSLPRPSDEPEDFVDHTPTYTMTPEQIRDLARQLQRPETNGIQDFLKINLANQALINSMLAKPDSEDATEKAAGKPTNIMSVDTQVQAFRDDMRHNLSPARFLPMSTDLDHSQKQVPQSFTPRTNYNLKEFGITLNQYKGVHRAHDRTCSSLQLKAFQHSNLAKIENNTQWKLRDGSITATDQEKNLSDTYDALSALLNFTIISQQICPANMEALQLMAAVFNTHFAQATKPSARDIAELFIRWNNERIQNLGTSKVIEYKWIIDNIRDIVAARKTTITEARNARGQLNSVINQLADTPVVTSPNRRRGGENRGGSRGSPANRGYKRDNPNGRGNTTPKKSRPELPNFCRDYNRGDCPRQPVDGRCTVGNGKQLLHACDKWDARGLPCGKEHPRRDHQ